MKRREFLAAGCVVGAAPLASLSMGAEKCDAKQKQLLELRVYKMESDEQRKRFVDFLGEAMIPALNRAGVKPVGVFELLEDESPDLFVLMPYCCLEAVPTVTAKLLADEKFLEAGAEVLDTAKDDKAYERVESSLLLAFDGIPKVELPVDNEGRIFQLRIYEAYSVKKGQKKIEMFNTGGELALFREVGMDPVFFGEALIGTRIPNLTYMLGFESIEAKETAWKRFLSSPKWDKLKKDPQYADTVSNITNIMLKPADCSQI